MRFSPRLHSARWIVTLIAFICILSVIPASAEPLVLFESRDNKIEMASQPNGVVSLQITATGAKVISTFPVDSPQRIVIDLTGELFPTKNLSAPENKILKGIRIGSHPGKTRVVVDLRDDTVVDFQVKSATNPILVEITPKREGQRLEAIPESQATLPPVKTPTTKPVIPTPTKAPTLTPTSQPTVTIASTPTSKPTKTATSPPTPTVRATIAVALKVDDIPPNPESLPKSEVIIVRGEPSPSGAVNDSKPSDAVKRAVVSAILFKNDVGNTAGQLIISTSGSPQFSLTKASNSLYELDVEGVELADQILAKPQFPSSKIGAFTYAIAANRSGGVHISIGVERGTKLAAVTRGSEIYLSPK